VEPLSLELAEFRSAILYGTPLRSSPQVGLDVVRTVEAVDHSLASGGLPVSLDGMALAGSVERELALRARGFNGNGRHRTDQSDAVGRAARAR
jgi:hypothetical protein